MENAQLPPQKYKHLRFHLRKVLAFRGTTDFAEHAFGLGVIFKLVKLVEPNILEA